MTISPLVLTTNTINSVIENNNNSCSSNSSNNVTPLSNSITSPTTTSSSVSSTSTSSLFLMIECIYCKCKIPYNNYNDHVYNEIQNTLRLHGIPVFPEHKEYQILNQQIIELNQKVQQQDQKLKKLKSKKKRLKEKLKLNNNSNLNNSSNSLILNKSNDSIVANNNNDQLQQSQLILSSSKGIINNNNSNNNIYFFKIWRNLTIRNNVKYMLMEGIVVNASSIYIERESTLPGSTWYACTSDDRKISELKSVVRIKELELNLTTPLIQEILPKGITKLVLRCNRLLVFGGIIPESVEVLHLHGFPQSISTGLFPSMLKVLYLHEGFNHFIFPGSLPNTLETLYLFDYSLPLQPNVLPNSLTSLSFGPAFTQPISSHVIPSSVVELNFFGPIQLSTTCLLPNLRKLAVHINSQVVKYLLGPNSISELRFIGYLCQQPLKPFDIPPTVTSLNLGDYDHFQRLEPGVLLPTLKSLNLGSKLSKEPVKLILSALTTLIMPSLKTIMGPIPSTVTYLDISGCQDPIKPNFIPNSVKTLIFNHSRDDVCPGAIPNSVTDLIFDSSFASYLPRGAIPDTVTKLKLGGINYMETIGAGVIPSSVKSLYLHTGHKQQPFILIPNSVTELEIVDTYQMKPRFLPNSIKSLTVSNQNHPFLWGSIPSSVKTLNLINNYSIIILPGEIPETVTKLKIKSVNFSVIEGSIPNSIKILDIDSSILSNRHNIPSTINTFIKSGIFDKINI